VGVRDHGCHRQHRLTFKKLYPHASSRAALAATGSSNPALRFLYGRLYGDSIGALTAWRYGVWAALFAAVMSVFVVVRHTRADEESGRLELVGSAAVGRQAPLTAGLLAAVQANVLIIVLLCLVLPLIGLPFAGSVALSLAIGGCGLAFTGITAVAAQLASGARTVRGIAFGVLAVAFMLRAVGDTSVSRLSWLSPLGWAELVRPFGGDRWWVLALPAVVVVLQLFGQVLELSHWVLDVSPFTHVPRLPGGAVTVAPLLWLSAAALACCLAGLYALRRRDIG